MGRVRAIITNFPPGGYFCIRPPLVNIEQAEESWKPDTAAGAVGHASFGLSAVVGPRSPLRLRRAVQQIAHYFQREMHYDFLQYNAAEYFEHTAFLWADPNSIDEKDRVKIIGACCFQREQFSDIGSVEVLKWIWIHPYRRGRGLLSKAWPYFENRFGKFLVDPPHSPGMEKFLSEKTRYKEWRDEWELAASLPSPPQQPRRD